MNNEIESTEHLPLKTKIELTLIFCGALSATTALLLWLSARL